MAEGRRFTSAARYFRLSFRDPDSMMIFRSK